jgi:alpha-maltose-1-phosphate synthase
MERRVLLLTNEYPPHSYGGAGVHVEYLARELATLTPVEVRTFGREDYQQGTLQVHGLHHDQAWIASAPAPPRRQRPDGQRPL